MTNHYYTIQKENGQLRAVRFSDDKLLGYIIGTDSKHYQALRSLINQYGWEETS